MTFCWHLTFKCLCLALPCLSGRTKLPPLKIKWIKKIYGSWVGRPVGLNRMSQGRSDRTLCTCTPMPIANEPCLFVGTPTPDAEK